MVCSYRAFASRRFGHRWRFRAAVAELGVVRRTHEYIQNRTHNRKQRPMNEPTQTTNPVSSGRNKWDFLIVLTSLAALLIVIFGILYRYNDASEAKAMLAFILPSLVAIVSAAFGISQAGKARIAEKDATTAEKAANKTRDVAQEALNQIAQLKDDIKQPFEAVETVFTCPPGSRKFKMADFVSDPASEVTFDVDALTSARTRIASIESALKQVI